jgi:hypothetical protein
MLCADVSISAYSLITGLLFEFGLFRMIGDSCNSHWLIELLSAVPSIASIARLDRNSCPVSLLSSLLSPCARNRNAYNAETMKTSKSRTDSQDLTGNVQMARRGVATAESRWKAAKRKRKEVKLLARRAKKEAKRAKANLVEATSVLAEAEARLAKSGLRLTDLQPARAKIKPVVKVGVTAPKKKAAPARKRRTAPSPAPESAVQIIPASFQEDVPPQTDPATVASETTEPPTTNPQ